jgi:hypothetical protein
MTIDSAHPASYVVLAMMICGDRHDGKEIATVRGAVMPTADFSELDAAGFAGMAGMAV